MINHCINNHTSMMAGCQVSGATLTMGVTWGGIRFRLPVRIFLLNNDLFVIYLLTNPGGREFAPC